MWNICVSERVREHAKFPQKPAVMLFQVFDNLVRYCGKNRSPPSFLLLLRLSHFSPSRLFFFLPVVSFLRSYLSPSFVFPLVLYSVSNICHPLCHRLISLTFYNPLSLSFPLYLSLPPSVSLCHHHYRVDYLSLWLIRGLSAWRQAGGGGDGGFGGWKGTCQHNLAPPHPEHTHFPPPLRWTHTSYPFRRLALGSGFSIRMRWTVCLWEIERCPAKSQHKTTKCGKWRETPHLLTDFITCVQVDLCVFFPFNSACFIILLLFYKCQEHR